MIRALWKSKWGFVRLAVAAFCLWVMVADTGARLARLELASLPDFDYAAQVRALRLEGRYGEALIVAAAGQQAEGLQEHVRAALEQERAATEEERSSVLRRMKDLGMGALSGKGDSLESLIGAVAADMLIVGDVRDLVIQGTKQVMDGDSDEVVLALSAAGIATTVVPEIDWVPSILKTAKKAGALTKGLCETIVESAKAGKFERLKPLMKDVGVIAENASPGGAIRLMRYAEDEAAVSRIAKFVSAEKRGAFALHVAGEEGVRLLKNGGEEVEKMLVKAAGKGRPGLEFLRSPGARAMMRPHPLIGLAKAVWKGNAAKLVTRLVDAVDPKAWWIVPALAAWVWIEGAMIARRLWVGLGGGRANRPIAAAA